MKKIITKTKDSSYTVFVPELNEHYHSYNGALTEANHIFIEAGFKFIQKEKVNIIEVGFGTGLNAALTASEACLQKRNVNYVGVELYPLPFKLVNQLGYSKLEGINSLFFDKIFHSQWESTCKISRFFNLIKHKADILEIVLDLKFDVVYYDAFSPEVQPELWTISCFRKIYSVLNAGGVLVTYSSKGIVKQALRSVGFIVKRLPGPLGKRHILRAIKPKNTTKPPPLAQ